MTRPLSDSDRRAVLVALREWCDTGNPVAFRTRAIVLLAADSGLRAGEVVELDLCQVLERRTAQAIVSSAYLRSDQAKGGDRGAGPFEVSRRAKNAIGDWLRVAVQRGWLTLPAVDGAPLFVGHRGYRGRAGHGRLSKRASQEAWYEVQRRAGLGTLYGFHSLRHDFATRLRSSGSDVLDLAALMRMRSVAHVGRYAARIDAAGRAQALVAAASRL